MQSAMKISPLQCVRNRVMSLQDLMNGPRGPSLDYEALLRLWVAPGTSLCDIRQRSANVAMLCFPWYPSLISSFAGFFCCTLTILYTYTPVHFHSSSLPFQYSSIPVHLHSSTLTLLYTSILVHFHSYTLHSCTLPFLWYILCIGKRAGSWSLFHLHWNMNEAHDSWQKCWDLNIL